VTFATRTGRTIVMHHASPDDAIFLILQFPASTDTSRTRDSMHVTIRPTPGRYGFTLTTADKLGIGTIATFSYALHFRTPAEAAAKYPSPGRFEQLLLPALVTSDKGVQFLKPTRPAADMLRFPVATSGTYALVVPR
jgi:hypothetical protein